MDKNLLPVTRLNFGRIVSAAVNGKHSRRGLEFRPVREYRLVKVSFAPAQSHAAVRQQRNRNAKNAIAQDE